MPEPAWSGLHNRGPSLGLNFRLPLLTPLFLPQSCSHCSTIPNPALSPRRRLSPSWLGTSLPSLLPISACLLLQHTRTHTRTHKHRDTHKHAQRMYKHAHTQTHTYMRTHRDAQDTRSRTHRHTHSHACTRRHIHSHAHIGRQAHNGMPCQSFLSYVPSILTFSLF